METICRNKKNSVFTCEKCQYTTNRKSNYLNHLNRITSCVKIKNENGQNVKIDGQNVKIDGQNVKIDYTICKKCNKKVCYGKLKRHLENCQGVSSLQCPKCKMVFNSRQTKYYHIKKQQCEMNNDNNNNDNDHNETFEFSSTTNIHPQIIYCTTINNTTNNYNIINFDNYTHDHINVENFKKDCLNAISSKDIIELYIKHTFFNNEHPETQNIRLTNLRPDYKFMDVYRDGWTKDIQSRVIGRIQHKSYAFAKNVIIKKESHENTDFLQGESNDKLELYEHKYISNCKFKESLKDIAKKTIYNCSFSNSNSNSSNIIDL